MCRKGGARYVGHRVEGGPVCLSSEGAHALADCGTYRHVLGPLEALQVSMAKTGVGHVVVSPWFGQRMVPPARDPGGRAHL